MYFGSQWIHRFAYGRISGKGDNSQQLYNIVHKFTPLPKAMKIPAAREIPPLFCVFQQFFRCVAPRWDPYTNLVRTKNENQVSTWNTKESGFSLKDKKSKFSLKSELRSRSTNFKPIQIGQVARNWVELLSLSEEKLIILLQVMNNSDEINHFVMNTYQNKIGIFVKLKSRVFMRWKNWSVQELRIDETSRRRLIENQDTINELTAKNQELQNWMNDSRVFQDAESVRSGLSHVSSQPALLPIYRDPGWLLSRNDKPPDIWNTHGISAPASSSPCPGGLILGISSVTEDTSPHVTSERLTPVHDQSCLSGPSARNSFDPSEGRFSKDYRADKQRLHISELLFDKFSTPNNICLLEDEIKTEVCTCSQFPKEATLWIKEVEMVESVDDLKSSRSF